jgi:hypothetical protein
VCLSLVVLSQKGEHGLRGQRVLPWIGAAISLYLMLSSSLSNILVGIAFVLLGIPVYVFYSRTHLGEIREMFLTQEEILVSNLEKADRFLPRLVRFVRGLFSRVTNAARL